MISRIARCSRHAAVTRACRLAPIPSQRPEPFRGVLDDLEHVGAEGVDELAREVRADPLDETGTEVLLDSFQSGRRDDPQVIGTKLETVGGIVDPGAQAVDLLAGMDRRGVAHHRGQITPPARLDLQDAEAGILVVEGDSLYQAPQRLRRAFGHGSPPNSSRARSMNPRIGSLGSSGDAFPGSRPDSSAPCRPPGIRSSRPCRPCRPLPTLFSSRV